VKTLQPRYAHAGGNLCEPPAYDSFLAHLFDFASAAAAAEAGGHVQAIAGASSSSGSGSSSSSSSSSRWFQPQQHKVCGNRFGHSRQSNN